MSRFGMGYDVHQLVEGRKLIIGGVEIPFEKGLLGHSDADVLLHAISDALLGAAALGDIGKPFPDTTRGQTAWSFWRKWAGCWLKRAIQLAMWMLPSWHRGRRWHHIFL